MKNVNRSIEAKNTPENTESPEIVKTISNAQHKLCPRKENDESFGKQTKDLIEDRRTLRSIGNADDGRLKQLKKEISKVFYRDLRNMYLKKLYNVR